MSQNIEIQDNPEPSRGLETIKKVVETVKEAIDPQYLNSRHRLASFAWGFSWEKAKSTYQATAKVLPDFPKIDTSIIEVGAMRGIAVNQVIALQKTLQSDPRPMFRHLNPVFDELRRQLFMAWWSEARVKEVVVETFQGGYGLGAAFTRFYFDQGIDGTFSLKAKAVQPWDVIWDAFEADPRKSRWIGWCFDIPVDEAYKAWPDKRELIKQCINAKESGSGANYRRVRVFEYYDKENRGVFLSDSFDAQKVLTWEPSPFRHVNRLPFACNLHLICPGVQRPVGTIEMQLSSAVMLDSMRQRMFSIAKSRPTQVINTGMLDMANQAIQQPGEPRTLNMKADEDLDARAAYNELPAEEVTQTFLAALDMLQRDFDMESYTTSAERNIAPQSGVTKYAEQVYQSSVAELGSWRESQLLEYLAELVEVSIMCMMVGHTAPIWLDYQGQNILFNDPERPDSSIRFICEEKSAVAIDATSIRASDQQRQMAMELSKLDVLKEYIASPQNPYGRLSMDEYMKRVLSAVGETDFDKWMEQLAPMAGVTGTPPDGSIPPVAGGDPALMVA
jgi:hypothetical protein